MTALAMVIGMVPMALGLGEGGEQNAPPARADGYLKRRTTDIGDRVRANQALAKVTAERWSNLLARGAVSRLEQIQSYKIVRAPFAGVTVNEIPGRVFQGSVARTANALDPASRTLLAEVRVPNPGGVLMPGMYAQVRVEMSRPDGPRVAVVRDGTVRFQKIRVGRDFGHEIALVWLAQAAELPNSPRVEKLIRAGRLYLSLDDVIALAVENNLDVEIQRLNLGVGAAELLRARAGGLTRGLNYTLAEAPAGVGGPASALCAPPRSSFRMARSAWRERATPSSRNSTWCFRRRTAGWATTARRWPRSSAATTPPTPPVSSSICRCATAWPRPTWPAIGYRCARPACACSSFATRRGWRSRTPSSPWAAPAPPGPRHRRHHRGEPHLHRSHAPGRPVGWALVPASVM